jgi:hypothetical protein
MNANKEKNTGRLGLVISVLLHAIFLASCYAYDASSAIKHSTDVPKVTPMNNLADHSDHARPKT